MANEISERIITMKIAKGSTDVSIQVPMVDITDGYTPETGLTVTDFDIAYSRVGAAAVKSDCVALATPAVTDPHLDNGCIEVDSTNMKGVYRFDLPDAIFASGVDNALIAIHHTSCRSVYIHVQLQNKLSSDGLDGISFTEPSAYPTNLQEGLMFAIMQVVNKVELTATQKKIYQDDDSTVALTQAVSDNGTTQTQGKGS